jgi:hypothetical protein
MRKAERVFRALAIALLFISTANMVWADGGGKSTETRLRTRLAGAAIQGKTPEGNADFRSDRRGRMHLNVEVEEVNLPAGTVLRVSVSHAGVPTAVGTITLSALGFGELELNSEDGDTVPAIVAGDMVVVSDGAVAILAGVF